MPASVADGIDAQAPEGEPIARSMHRYPLPDLQEVSVASLKGGTLFVKLKDASSSLEGQDIVTSSGVSLTQALVNSGQIEQVTLAFGSSTQAIMQEQRQGQHSAGFEDLSQWYVIKVADTANPVEIAHKLYEDDNVETAYPAPKIAHASMNGDPQGGGSVEAFQNMIDVDAWQVYDQGSNFWGIDIKHLRERREREIRENVPLHQRRFGAVDGKGVRVVDVEHGFNLNHVDLSAMRESDVFIPWDGKVFNPEFDTHHGTAVVSIMSADRNGMGMTGLVPDAKLHVSCPLKADANGFPDWSKFNLRLFNTIYQTAKRLSAGDVMVLEYQIISDGDDHDDWKRRVGCAPVTGETTQPRAIPLEFDQLYSVAIKYAVDRGIHVVQAAGNGAQNLGHTCFTEPGVYSNLRDQTGSILVGAGTAPVCWQTDSFDPSRNRTQTPGLPTSFSNYGTPVDLQGWGQCILTLAPIDEKGGLGATVPNAEFSTRFGGTSGASPIVAAAVVSLSAIAKDQNKRLGPAEMLNKLKDTGTQPPLAWRKIGPLPNLRKAAADLLGIPAEPETERPR